VQLADVRPLGRSGLLVSPLTLGTMTMANSSWGSTDEESAAVFDAYIEAGGRSVDTADVYSGGRSEGLLGRFIEERGIRDEIVLATKYAFNADPGGSSRPTSPLYGGSSRKNMHRALEGSLRRLRTDHIDLYWMHVWDRVTPAEEVVESLTDMVRAGTIRYYALSDVPAWFAVRVATLAEVNGVPGPVALQLEYSLVARTIEYEHVPAAQAIGLGIVPWSPLAGGFLAGKYRRGETGGEGRLSGDNPFGDSKFTDRNWDVLEALLEVADEVAATPSQVALAWAATRPGVASVILGARTVEQLTDNVGALDVELSSEQLERLTTAGEPTPTFSSGLTDELVRNAVFAGATVLR